MDGYSHLSIAEREDIMVRWKGHGGGRPDSEGAPQGQAGHIPRDQAERLAGPCRAPLPRVHGTEEGRQEEAALQAPQAHGRTREALAGRGAHAGRALVPGGDIGPHLGGAARPRRERFRHPPCRGVGIPGLRASGAPEGRKAAQAPWKARAREGRPGARGQGAHNP